MARHLKKGKQAKEERRRRAQERLDPQQVIRREEQEAVDNYLRTAYTRSKSSAKQLKEADDLRHTATKKQRAESAAIDYYLLTVPQK
ncbi:MAG: hypothetical protein HYT20_00470 [Candidatus Nealsonbacteria bacterium]|nr:hypothetical protein [Candidatus Nealsonbacteria bacterium]